ncbi:MAG: alpha-L-fucosidase, partial [Muribaculaceae bacterium]|nr:alpha-L-fucosidase [Muribaculaceae bacterium]
MAVGQNVESNLQNEFAKKAIDNGEQRVYVPSKENLQARKEFEDKRFGIFVVWGFYSVAGQGEWAQTRSNIPFNEYTELASAFYPSRFDAKDWIDLFKEAGAK